MGVSRVRRLAFRLIRGLASLLIVAAVLVAAVGSGFLAYNIHHANRIFPGVTIQGVSVGGLFPTEALQRVHGVLNGAAYPYVHLYSSEGEWTLGTRELGARVDVESAVREAFLLGREGVFRHDMVTRLKLLWWGYDIVPAFSLEPGEALLLLNSVAREAGHPARKAQLWIGGLQATTDASQAGREMDVEATRAAVERDVAAALGVSGWGSIPRLYSVLDLTETHVRAEMPGTAALSPYPTQPIDVRVSFREIVPPLTEVEGGRERAEQVLASPVVVRFGFPQLQADGSERVVDQRWAADRARLSTWLTVHSVVDSGATGGAGSGGDGVRLVVDVDREAIVAWLTELAPQIERSPADQRFAYDPATNQLHVTVPGRNGFGLDVATSAERVAQACFAPPGPGRTAELAVRVISPRVTYAELADMLPLALVGEGESGFSGSTPERLQNIKTASARFQGVAVPADTTFSFLSHLGLVTAANGYSESWVIVGDRTELGAGGGVCQVSTTCFRAAFWAGLPIIERWPHSYRVGWYEPPLGLDAAVFEPTTDLKFVNDTGAPLLILTEVNEQASTLTFRFYGRDTGRKVTLEGPETGEPIPPGDPVFEEDPTLAAGSRVLVERAREGLDVTVHRVIEVDGKKGERQPFVSKYKPWPARYRVGTKTE